MDRSLLCVLLATALLLCSSAPVDRHGESDAHCPLMVKILDAVKGIPAGSVALKVSRQDANGMTWAQVASGVTDVTGEVHNLISEQDFQSGVYRVEFDTKAYWKSQGTTPFHQTAEVRTLNTTFSILCGVRGSRRGPSSLHPGSAAESLLIHYYSSRDECPRVTLTPAHIPTGTS
ncbi:transthyretin isoform X1 [Esox lucius]|uniref:Transthyretin n=1 Tax=Esox lucius TaxID=8010 RepID=A0AAY5KZX4_ESOLU|nr:transthyretin isoform X1 [Esox lucius]